MNEQDYPSTTVNPPRPTHRLLRNAFPLPLQETPPQIPQIDEHGAIDDLGTMQLQSVTVNRKNPKSLFVPPLSFIDDESDISTRHTTQLPSVYAAVSTPAEDKQADQLIYANTAYARR